MLNSNREPRSRLLALRIESVHHNMNWKLFIIAVLGVLLAACGFSENTPHITDTPESTQTVAPANGSIRGMVWHDLCVNFDDADILPPGCVVSSLTGRYLANGIFESGEEGITGVEVFLGFGPCPSSGLGVALTDTDGRYAFTDLAPGLYCVSANLPTYHQLASLEPGFWTYPIDDGVGAGSYSLTLDAGENRDSVNFGWDNLVKPPPSTPEPTREPEPPPTCTDEASFIKDVTIPDGTRVGAGKNFTKAWRIRNSGSCTWSADYSLVLVSGYSLGGFTNVPLRGDVLPGKVVDLMVDLRSPVKNGSYKGFWMLRNSHGELFGIGKNANSPFWVNIKVGPDPDPEITEWRGEYFDNRKLEGDPVLVRNDKKINFNWKKDSPASVVPDDNFSVRWTREVEFDEAIYRFVIHLDDGVRFEVDDQLVVYEWKDGSNREVTVDLAMSKGEHDLKLEYYEHGGEARVSLMWNKVSDPFYPVWKGEYWFNIDLDSDWALVRNDQAINFDWGNGSPALGIPKNDFSSRWSRSVYFEPGEYRFYGRSDDGLRVYLDNGLIINEWHLSGGTEVYTAELTLAGLHNLKIEYFEHTGGAKVEFWWEKMKPLNDPPGAVNDAYDINEDSALQVTAPGVLENDIDVDGDPLTVVLEGGVSNGDLTLNEDGSFFYQPLPDFNGMDTFTYVANDGSSASNIATVAIKVKSVDDEPVAVDDIVMTQEGTLIDIDVLGNDIGLGDTPVNIVVAEFPVQGTAEVADSQIRYVPADGFSGQDSFSYMLTDIDGDSSTAMVTVAVNSINSPPMSVDDAYSVEEDGVLSVEAPGVLGNDIDQDGDSLTAVLEGEPSNGVVTLNADGSFLYSPDTDFNGVDNFDYKASDGLGASNVAAVTIMVNPRNELPVAVDDAYSVDEDSVLDVSALGVLEGDIDVDGDTLTAVLENGPTSGSLTLNQNGSFTYMPDPDFNGTDNFTYKASDGSEFSNIALVTITVNPVNDAPQAIDDNANTEGDEAIDINVLANDTDLGDQPVMVTLESLPGEGTAEVIDNQIRYKPYGGYIGTDIFSYTVTDADGESSTVTVTVTLL